MKELESPDANAVAWLGWPKTPTDTDTVSEATLVMAQTHYFARQKLSCRYKISMDQIVCVKARTADMTKIDKVKLLAE